jgi:hypothetical protein
MKRLLNAKSSDGLIGMWAHTYDDDGGIEWQFQIIRRSGDVYLCKLYSWVDGSPTGCVAIGRNKILGLKLYESCEAMNDALEKHIQQGQWRRMSTERTERENSVIVSLRADHRAR